MKKIPKIKIALLGFFLMTSLPTAYSAEKVALVSGAFKRSIKVENIEHLAKTGEAKGFLKDALRFGNQNPKELVEILNQEVELPLVTTTRLMYSRIGIVIMSRVAKIIHPLKVPDNEVAVPALRSAVIIGLKEGQRKINAISFPKAYPNKTMAVNLPQLFALMNKVETINDVIKFFASSPLEDL